MLLQLFLAFTLIPLAELYLLVEVGGRIGALPTIAIVLLTGFTGAWLARMEGLRTMMRVREQLNQGKMPTDELIDGVLILIAGIVLFTPGFLTDMVGLLLLFPPTRMAFRAFAVRKFTQWAASGRVHVQHSGFGQSPFGQGQDPFGGQSPFGQPPFGQQPGPAAEDDVYDIKVVKAEVVGDAEPDASDSNGRKPGNGTD